MLDITVKNDVSFFSKSKTSMGQVLAVMASCKVGISSLLDNLLNAQNLPSKKCREIIKTKSLFCGF